MADTNRPALPKIHNIEALSLTDLAWHLRVNRGIVAAPAGRDVEAAGRAVDAVMDEFLRRDLANGVMPGMWPDGSIRSED